MNTIQKEPYLPRCVRKKELVNYFGENRDFFWTNILTDELLTKWGTSYEAIKNCRALPFDLTEKIYLHFKITDLNEPNYERIRELIDKETRSL